MNQETLGIAKKLILLWLCLELSFVREAKLHKITSNIYNFLVLFDLKFHLSLALLLV